MSWNIIYLESIEEWLDELTDEQLASVAKELLLLEAYGHRLKLPHSRSLGKGLFELRERKYGLRLYYGFDKGHVIVILHAGKKDTQERDIKRSRKLLSQYGS